MNEEAQSSTGLAKDSERFGNVPHPSESFGTIPKHSERKENHTLTVREAARSFEAAGVARTERSIINWCQFNLQGVARLDAYFDPNERKYFITPQSVELAIAEERAKSARNMGPSESFGSLPKDSESNHSRFPSREDSERTRELEKDVMDLKITNRGKDFFIEQLQRERESNVEQLMTFSRKVGELETKLLQLSAGLVQNRDGDSGTNSEINRTNLRSHS